MVLYSLGLDWGESEEFKNLYMYLDYYSGFCRHSLVAKSFKNQDRQKTGACEDRGKRCAAEAAGCKKHRPYRRRPQ